MPKRKDLSHFLPHFLLVISIIAIGIIIFFNKIDTHKIIVDNISSILKNRYNINFSFENFNFNDKQLIIQNVTLNKEFLHITIPTIKINYTLSNFFRKSKKAISTIAIFNPKTEIDFSNLPQNNNKNNFEIPDISTIFKNAKIFNLSLKYSYQKDDIAIFDSINFKEVIINNKKQETTLIWNNSKIFKSTADITIEDNSIKTGEILIKDYLPKKLYIGDYLSIKAKISSLITIKNNSIKYNINLNKCSLSSSDFDIFAKNIDIIGNSKQAFLSTENLSYCNEPVFLNAKILNPLSKKMTLKGNINSPVFYPKKIYRELNGFAKIDGYFFATYSSINYFANIKSKNINFFDENIDDIDINFSGNHKIIDFTINNASYKNNETNGYGKYDFDKFVVLNLKSIDSNIDLKHFSIFGNTNNKLIYDYEKGFSVTSELDNIIIKNDLIAIDNIKANIKLNSSEIFVDYINLNNSIKGNFNYNWSKDSISFKNIFDKFILKNYWLGKNKYFKNFQYVSGNLEYNDNDKIKKIFSSIKIFDKYFGKVTGKIIADYFLDKNKNNANLNFNLKNAKYNYEPISISINAQGDKSYLKSNYCLINDDISIAFTTNWKNKLWYKIALETYNLPISKYLKYSLNQYDSNLFNGNISLFGCYDSRENGDVKGKFNIANFNNITFKNININGNFEGKNSLIKFPEISITSQENDLIQLKSEISVKNGFNFFIKGFCKNIKLKNFINNVNLTGNLSSSFYIEKSKKQYYANFNNNIKNADFYGFKINDADINLEQDDNVFNLTKCKIIQDNLQITAKGSLPYNFFKEEAHDDSLSVNVNIKGDLLKQLTKQFDLFESATSEYKSSFTVNLKNDNINIDKGKFILKNGVIKIKDQSQPIKNINVNLNVDNGILNIKKFLMNIENGKFNIKNKITKSNEDIIMGNINLGKILFKTSKNGILIHVPEYMPDESLINVIIKGENSKFGSITGPVDNLIINAHIDCFNGDAIYPPNTKNILSLLTSKTENNYDYDKYELKEDSFEIDSLPFDVKLKINFINNVRYVTYPVNLLIDSDSYMFLEYSKENDKWEVPKALFNVNKGTLYLFDETFKTEDLQVIITPFQDDIQFFGEFNKKTSNGTNISLEIFNNKNNDINKLGLVQIKLSSDNPEDISQAHIIARLKYSRNLDELTKHEQEMVFQDEALNYAEIEIKNKFFDPIVSPIENIIRKFFNLDSFYVELGLVQNIFDIYISNNDFNKEVEKEYSVRIERDILLNNLYISAGKYLTKNVFFNYEITLKKDELEISKNLLAYQTLSLRYDLPSKWKLFYKFDINPVNTKNTHEIIAVKEFKFNLPNFIWRQNDKETY